MTTIPELALASVYAAITIFIVWYWAHQFLKKEQNVILTAYAIFILTGCATMFAHLSLTGLSERDAISYRATHDLMQNHLLTLADLEDPRHLPADLSLLLPEKSKLAGKYVSRCRIPKNHAITLEDISSGPVKPSLVELEANRIRWGVSLTSLGLKEPPVYLNAGSWVLLYSDANCVAPGQIAEVYCPMQACSAASVYVHWRDIEKLKAKTVNTLLPAEPDAECPAAPVAGTPAPAQPAPAKNGPANLAAQSRGNTPMTKQ